MSKLHDYSKWDNIECSDDETEDLPPTLDKDSYKKYTKSKRTQRDAEEEKEIAELKRRVKKAQKELRQLGEAGRTHVKGQQLEKKLAEDEAQLAKLERTLNRRVNADKLISTEKFSRGLLTSDAIEKEGYSNASAPKIDGNVDETVFESFVRRHEKMLEGYVDLGDIEGASGLRRSCEYILKNPEVILSSDAETFCMFHCLGLEMEGKTKEMKRAARQGQLISQALQLSKMLAMPRQALDAAAGEALVLNKKGTENMLEKLQEDEELQKSFFHATDQFVARIQKRAVEKLAEENEAEEIESATNTNGGGGSGSKGTDSSGTSTSGAGGGKTDTEETAESIRGKQLGPGGLDAQEVFETLPETLQDAFISKNGEKLQTAFAALPEEEAKYHLQRCVKSGLWVVPGYGGDAANDGRESDSD